MREKSKYDIIDELTMKISMEVLDCLSTLGDLTKKIEASDIDMDEFQEDSQEVFKEVFPKMRMVSHLGYENAKDLFNVDQRTLLSYFKSNRINIVKFNEDYSKVLNRYAKMLLTFLVMEEEDIDVTEFKSIDSFSQLVKGDTTGILEMMNESSMSFSPENRELVVGLADSNFYAGNLSAAQIQRLNNFHDEFMKRRIYPQITKVVDEKNKVLEKAIMIGRLGPFN